MASTRQYRSVGYRQFDVRFEVARFSHPNLRAHYNPLLMVQAQGQGKDRPQKVLVLEFRWLEVVWRQGETCT